MSEGLKIQRGNRVLSYLPLSHIAGLMLDVYFPMINKGTTFFADKKALKGSLVDNLHWCRPTDFFGVPRVWEKVRHLFIITHKGTLPSPAHHNAGGLLVN